jgi:hypothetical protein
VPFAITAANDRDKNAAIFRPPREPRHKWRLPCSSDRQIANADHRRIDPHRLHEAVIESPIPSPDYPAIGAFQRPQNYSQDRRLGSCRIPADDPAKLRFRKHDILAAGDWKLAYPSWNWRAR